MLAAVILSAGESSRMGAPKALVRFRGQTFMERLLGAIRNATGEAGNLPAGRKIALTRVVLGAGASEIRNALHLEPADVVINLDWKSGQLSSIQAAIRNLMQSDTLTENDKGVDGMMLFLVDHPLIGARLVETLAQKFHDSGRAIVLPTFRGKRGHPVIFARRLWDELLAADPQKGARAVVWAHSEDVLEVPTEEVGAVLNVNDPEALRRAADIF